MIYFKSFSTINNNYLRETIRYSNPDVPPSQEVTPEVGAIIINCYSKIRALRYHRDGGQRNNDIVP